MISWKEAVGEEKVLLATLLCWSGDILTLQTAHLIWNWYRLYRRASAGLRGAPRCGGGIAALGDGGRARFPICRFEKETHRRLGELYNNLKLPRNLVALAHTQLRKWWVRVAAQNWFYSLQHQISSLYFSHPCHGSYSSWLIIIFIINLLWNQV